MGIFLPFILVGVIFLMLLIVFVSKYQTAKPDEALIISGSYLGSKNVHTDDNGNKIKIVRGGGAFVLPVFQRSNRISLLSSKLDVSTPEVYMEQGVPVMCDGTSIIKIGSSVEENATAAEQFLGKTTEELENEAREVLEGHLRSILGSMTVEEIYQNRDKFSQSVQEVASVDLAKMGLIIVSFTIKEVRDKNGYLDSLGKPRIAQVKRDADIAEAEALKETRIKKAEAEKESQQAELQRQTEIAEASKEKELKLALYKQEQDIAKAKADQAYNLESARAQQHVVEQEMEVKVVERQKQIELEEKEIIRREKQYDSEVKKKADADRYAKEQEAQAQKAREVAEAEAERFRVEALAEAEANQTRLSGQAQADAILARGKAEAEAKQKIADAFKEYGQGELSGEYQLAANFLKETQAKVSRQKGTITNVAGFSQAGGYMMKIATEYGRVYGFHTTSFDDWGNHQFDTLTTQEQAWLQKHPHLLTRYQNDSWADYSFRDHTYGNVIPVTGIGEHTTLAAYFDGNMLNLDRLAQAGIFAPQMSKAQVEIAAKNWAQRNGDWNPFTDDNREIKQRVKEYIKLYGSFSIIEFQTKLAKLKQLKKQLAASGGGLSANEKIYLDDRQTLVAVNLAQQTIKAGAASILAIYQAAIVETEQEWEAGLQLARIIGTELNEAEIIAALAKFGTTKESVVTEPSDFYTEKINEIRGLATSFDTLATEIKAGLSILVQKDQELATQLKIGGG